MTESQPGSGSPPWGQTTKLVVGLTFVAIVAALVIRFRGIIGPLLLAFILAYVLHPVVDGICQSARLSWRASVNIVYLILVIFLGGLLTVAGLAVIQQLQSLSLLIQRFVADLPTFAEELSGQVYTFGPFSFDLSQFDLATVSEQLLNAVQPLVGQFGTLIRTLATGAAGLVGWGGFTLLISYFVLADSRRWFPETVISLDIPGHREDISRLGRSLGRIWNAFLRGQLILFVLAVAGSAAIFTILGVRFGLGLAILVGLARFVPYVGPWTVSVVTFLVAFFQESNYLGFTPLQYALLTVISQVVLDQFFDNYLSPRFMGRSLGVHPAAVLVSAIIATNLIGLVGLLLAAPVLATAQLIGRYAFRKMFELEPWTEAEPEDPGSFNLRINLGVWQDRFRRLQRRGVEDDEGKP